MRVFCLVFIAGSILLGLNGCGGTTPSAVPSPAPVSPAIEQSVPQSPPFTAPVSATAAPAPASSASPVAPSDPGVTDPIHKKLLGTTWNLGDFKITFVDATKIRLQGGPLRTLAPTGIDAKYAYAQGDIKIIAMGQTKSGTWDGEKLIIEGVAAQSSL